ncbi:MAG TPA: carbohydrate ABC transporter permease [Tissierellaceae bacterium]|nr:carbohydrate ABC transporter permease [Tissierellaceae bacterium]
MKRTKLNNLVYYVTIIIFLIFTLGPIVWSIIMSITPESEMLKNSPNILPQSIYFGNYKEVLDSSSSAHQRIFTGLKNSISISFITILVGIPISVITGYAFSRYKFKGKYFILKFILITIVIPVFTTIIPIYSIFSNYGMLDNLFWISIIYVSAFLPINSWIIMNYFNSIPTEILEAAIIDGASERAIFFKIILPLSYPIIITTTLTMFLMSWSQFQIPLILTASQSKKVITLILSEFMTRDTISYGLIAVSGIFSIIPPAIIAIIFRKFLITGLTSGSVK